MSVADAETETGPSDKAEPVGPSPTQIENPEMRREANRALIWTLVVGLLVLAIYLAQSLLVIFGALVIAAMLDGGARLIGRWIPIGRAWRVMIVLLIGIGLLFWLVQFAGAQIAAQAAEFPELITTQLGRLIAFLRSKGLDIGQADLQDLASQAMSGVGTLSRVVGGFFGGLATMVLMLTIGIYLAVDPRPYERGLSWMIAERHRAQVADTLDHMAFNMRRLLAGRLLGMVAEGVFTWGLLSLIGVPMAALLGLITGILAFIPNIGALTAGILMTLVGFSGGTEMGLWTIASYFFIQTFDGYVLVPLIAKKTVDLAPALVLGFQLVMGVLFGVLGLTFADPMLAMIKVALERRAHRLNRDGAG